MALQTRINCNGVSKRPVADEGRNDHHYIDDILARDQRLRRDLIKTQKEKPIKSGGVMLRCFEKGLSKVLCGTKAVCPFGNGGDGADDSISVSKTHDKAFKEAK